MKRGQLHLLYVYASTLLEMRPASPQRTQTFCLLSQLKDIALQNERPNNEKYIIAVTVTKVGREINFVFSLLYTQP